MSPQALRANEFALRRKNSR